MLTLNKWVKINRDTCLPCSVCKLLRVITPVIRKTNLKLLLVVMHYAFLVLELDLKLCCLTSYTLRHWWHLVSISTTRKHTITLSKENMLDLLDSLNYTMEVSSGESEHRQCTISIQKSSSSLLTARKEWSFGLEELHKLPAKLSCGPSWLLMARTMDLILS